MSRLKNVQRKLTLAAIKLCVAVFILLGLIVLLISTVYPKWTVVYLWVITVLFVLENAAIRWVIKYCCQWVVKYIPEEDGSSIVDTRPYPTPAAAIANVFVAVMG